MIINSTGEKRPVISTFDQMRVLGARFTSGDIGISQNSDHPTIYFCTSKTDNVPIGITPDNAEFSKYFTPYYVTAEQLDEGEVYEVATHKDVEDLLAGKYSSKRVKLVTTDLLAAFMSNTYVNGLNISGGYLNVTKTNYKTVLSSLISGKSYSLLLTDLELPISDYEDPDRDFFIPHDVSIGKSDVGIFRLIKSEDSHTGISINLKELIIVNSDYLLRFIYDGYKWHDLSEGGDSVYANMAKEVFDKARVIHSRLKASWDSINQIQELPLYTTELATNATLTNSVVQCNSDGDVIISLSSLKREFIKSLGGSENKKYVDNMLLRLNTAYNTDLGIVSDSAMIDLDLLLNGGVNYLRMGNIYQRVRKDEVAGTYLIIPKKYLLQGAETELSLDKIKERVKFYVMNITWTNKV